MGEPTHILLNHSSVMRKGEKANSKMLRVRSTIAPRNSGIQNIVPELYDALIDAESMEPRYREFAQQQIENRELGMMSISSEGGDMLKMLQTTRTISHIETRNQGPPASAFDKQLYGKNTFKNNPSGEYDKLF